MLTVSAAAAKVSEGMGGFKTLGVPAATQHSGTCDTLDPSCLPLTQNLNGVMVAMAELLSMKIPSSYEVLFPDGPVRAAVVEAKKVETDMAGECSPCPHGPLYPQTGIPMTGCPSLSQECWEGRRRLWLGRCRTAALSG